MRQRSLIWSLALLMVTAPAAYAIDHKNLDEGRPLRLDDAYAIASGELAVEVGAGVALERRGPDRGVFPLEGPCQLAERLVSRPPGVPYSAHEHAIYQPL
jgi:hypothetical protein